MICLRYFSLHLNCFPKYTMRLSFFFKVPNWHFQPPCWCYSKNKLKEHQFLCFDLLTFAYTVDISSVFVIQSLPWYPIIQLKLKAVTKPANTYLTYFNNYTYRSIHMLWFFSLFLQLVSLQVSGTIRNLLYLFNTQSLRAHRTHRLRLQQPGHMNSSVWIRSTSPARSLDEVRGEYQYHSLTSYTREELLVFDHLI